MNMNKIEVTFPSADPSCQLSGDLTLPLDGGDETKLLPAIVIVAGSGVSYMLAEIILMHMCTYIILCTWLYNFAHLLYTHILYIHLCK